ncbi:recombinase family protein [Brytella acorum]|uniref:Recombinase family protein n=1 Tax=Brytella acorum TaxID=2959299 RepID=A0AA35XYG7_9PROT|nr:recombinase family protein [Brytella acorum]MDF3625716.1 recombinase family protein [Brytella acorum]CAI9121345.1 recombinase family protein [Brytella acorum]
MKIGYARTSTTEQMAGLESQQRDLVAAGCGRVYAERISGAKTDRPELTAALDHMRPGDVLVVTKPDRLARSTADLLRHVDTLKAKGCGLIVLSMNGTMLDTTNPTSKLMLTMLAAVAEFERDIMKERQAEGIAKAKMEGKYKGRKPSARNQEEEVRALAAQGIKPTEIARKLGMGRTSVYRCLGK